MGLGPVANTTRANGRVIPDGLWHVTGPPHPRCIHPARSTNKLHQFVGGRQEELSGRCRCVRHSAMKHEAVACKRSEGMATGGEVLRRHRRHAEGGFKIRTHSSRRGDTTAHLPKYCPQLPRVYWLGWQQRSVQNVNGYVRGVKEDESDLRLSCTLHRLSHVQESTLLARE